MYESDIDKKVTFHCFKSFNISEPEQCRLCWMLMRNIIEFITSERYLGTNSLEDAEKQININIKSSERVSKTFSPTSEGLKKAFIWYSDDSDDEISD